MKVRECTGVRRRLSRETRSLCWRDGVGTLKALIKFRFSNDV
jgi:hypothetical protein